MVSSDPIMVENVGCARAIVRSTQFTTYPMEQMYIKLEAATSIDFSATRTLMRNLPVYMDGTEHKKTRKLMAARLAETRSAQEQSAKDALCDLHQKYFTRPCQFDLFRDFAHPLWRSISNSIVDFGPDVMNLVDQLPGLFAPTLSIRKRILLNQQIEGVLRDGDDGILVDLALATLGVRPFTGSFALSVFDLVRSNPGKKYSELPFEPHYNESSLTFIDRIASGDVSVEGRRFAKGDHVRCITRSDRYSQSDNTSNLYGVGSHVCLGRPISQYVIRLLPVIAKEYPVMLQCVDLSWQKNSVPFSMPATAVVRVDL